MSGYTRDDELFASLALIKSKGMGPRTWRKILDSYQTPAHAIAHSKQWKGAGLVRINQAEAFHSRAWESRVLAEIKTIRDKNYEYILWSDPEYPEKLKQVSDPPLILYYRGDISLLKNYGLAVVGSRQSSGYGQEMAATICKEISCSGITIISGFAYGIDRQAHMASVDNSGSTIAVLGTGIDLIYPGMNKDLWVKVADKGLIITEFFPGTKPDARNFPYRNRIISGLSLGVLVIQSALKSGSMITATLALEQNKEVFAVPGAVTMENYDGCNHLIKQGAHLVQGPDDIMEILAPLVKVSGKIQISCHKNDKKDVSPVKIPENLTPDEGLLLEKLKSGEQFHIDELTKGLDWSSQKVSQMLVILEIKSLVKRRPGMYYSMKR